MLREIDIFSVTEKATELVFELRKFCHSKL